MIKAQTKRIVRLRFVMCCGYCGISEQDVGAMLTFDHYKPRTAGGTDDPDNLIYACHACNEFKGDYWQDDAARLLHPLHDNLTQHIKEEPDETLTGLDQLGNTYISRLQLNRAPLVAHRFERKNRTIALAQRVKENALLEEILREIQQIKDSRRNI